MASSSGSDTTSMLLGRYRVEATLGEGSFGTVVRAFDLRLKRTVAIKMLKRSLAMTDIEQFRALEERFAREAEAGSRMRIHTNLVTVHDLVIEPDRTQYLILEYVQGGTLAERLSRGPLPLSDALRVTADIARGLQAAHDVGIVHRDVKPANIFLTPDGRAQLGDFGIAQIDDVSGRTHAVVRHPGTPLYMSPEQAQTTGYVRPASDQYSLGLVFFEMLTAKAYKRIGERAAADLLASQPAAVASLIEDMVAVHPDDRLLSCDHAARRIQAIVRNLGLTETQLAAPPDQARNRANGRPPGMPSDDAVSTDPFAAPLADKRSTAARANAATAGFTSAGTARLEASPPPPATFSDLLVTDAARGRSRRSLGIGTVVAVALLLAVGIGAAILIHLGDTTARVTQTPQQPAAALAAATVVASPSVVPAIQLTALPTVAPAATIAPMVAPTATPPPPTAVPTAIPPTATVTSSLAVFSVGTTNANLETVNGDDVVTMFTAGQDVYGWINFGGAQVNKDVLEVTLIANGAPQPPQSFTLTKSDGFQVFPLGKLGAGEYRLEARYVGKVAQTADFYVSSPTPPRQPTPVPRTNPVTNPSNPVNPVNPVQPTAVPSQPTSAPPPTIPPKPTVYIPPTQPPPKP